MFSRNGVVLNEGDPLVQLDLAATLTQFRVAGVGDLYQGTLARRLAQESPLAGGPMSFDDLRGALPTLADALIEPWHSEKVAFLPPPADGGLAAAAAFETLRAEPPRHKPGRGPFVGGGGALAAGRPDGGGAAEDRQRCRTRACRRCRPPPPGRRWTATAMRWSAPRASAICSAPAVSFRGWASCWRPRRPACRRHCYAAALAWNANLHVFRAEVGGSGQAGAPLAVAVGMANTLATGAAMRAEVPDPGRANVIGCAGYLPGEEQTCRWATDPRGAGLAVGGS